MIDRLVDAGAPVDRCCKVLGVARRVGSGRKLRSFFRLKSEQVCLPG